MEHGDDPRLERIIGSAIRHEDENPNMGMGDLEQALRIVWMLLPEPLRDPALKMIFELGEEWVA